MRRLLAMLLASFLFAGAAEASQCRVNLRFRNNYAGDWQPGQDWFSWGNVIDVWLLQYDASSEKARVKKGSLWNNLCDRSGGDDCTCPVMLTLMPGQEYTCSTKLEDACDSGTRDFEIVYTRVNHPQGGGEACTMEDGAFKVKNDISVFEGKNVTFAWGP